MKDYENGLKELERQFVAIAGNINNSLDITMLKTLTKNLELNYIDEELQHLIEEVDEDGNGEIDFKEFLKALENKSMGDEYIIKQAFAILDRTDLGYITRNDLRHAMLCLGENYTIEEVNEMISLVDDDQDGVINFQEFNKLIKKCVD